MLDWVKIVAGLIGLASNIIAWRKSAGDKMDGYNQAVDAATVGMYKNLGRVDVIVSQGAQLTPEDKRKVLKDD